MHCSMLSIGAGRKPFMLAIFKGNFQSALLPADSINRWRSMEEYRCLEMVIVVMAMPLFYLPTLIMMEVN